MPILVCSVVSAAVAVGATEVLAPAYAGAAPAARTAKASVTVRAVDRLVAKDYAATSHKLGSLQSMINANATQLGALTTNVANLQSQLATLTTNVATLQTTVNSAGASAAQAQTLAGQATNQLTALTPIVKSTAERLYDTCALTSSLWQRSFPSIDGNTANTTWTADIGNEVYGNTTAYTYALDRCYSALAGAAAPPGYFHGGMLPSFARPDDAFTAVPPTG